MACVLYQMVTDPRSNAKKSFTGFNNIHTKGVEFYMYIYEQLVRLTSYVCAEELLSVAE